MQAVKVHQQNHPVLNWRRRLTQVDLYNGHKTMVVVVVNQHLCHVIDCVLCHYHCLKLA